MHESSTSTSGAREVHDYKWCMRAVQVVHERCTRVVRVVHERYMRLRSGARKLRKLLEWGQTARQWVVPRQLGKLLGGRGGPTVSKRVVPQRLLRKLLNWGPTARKRVVSR